MYSGMPWQLGITPANRRWSPEVSRCNVSLPGFSLPLKSYSKHYRKCPAARFLYTGQNSPSISGDPTALMKLLQGAYCHQTSYILPTAHL